MRDRPAAPATTPSGVPVAAASNERCQRCGGSFHCGIADAGPCACTTVQVDAATLLALRVRYTGCLCLRCLGEVAAGGDTEPAPQRAANDGGPAPHR